MFFFPDAQMDDQDLNEPIAKVALLKGKFIFVSLNTCSTCKYLICIYKLMFLFCFFFFNQMCVNIETHEIFRSC